ncbi:hypothetical protein [Pseudomonas coronafaciens]|uniref:hypothetical protein n=1 Tax=Pseudomonas coronafaciens TaxID=53409 RepID=UPI001424AA9D|nr:hypothetical protein [Pseudomonas coronafaciens]QIQ73938.1 hypothetical protein HBB04_04353 [Pseudomonas coronafaciens]
MTAHNAYKWQQDRIQRRLEIIEDTLNQLDSLEIKFNKVTFLARYVAEAISTAELQALENTIKNGIDIKISKTATCRANSLLKSKTYRYRLDTWMRRVNPRSDQESAELAELRFKLLRLSNEHAITVDELRQLQEIHSTPSTNTYIATTDRNDGMTIADAMIQHFKEFCEIESGALIEPSPTRPIIVPANLFASYLRWKTNIY